MCLCTQEADGETHSYTAAGGGRFVCKVFSRPQTVGCLSVGLYCQNLLHRHVEGTHRQTRTSSQKRQCSAIQLSNIATTRECKQSVLLLYSATWGLVPASNLFYRHTLESWNRNKFIGDDDVTTKRQKTKALLYIFCIFYQMALFSQFLIKIVLY